LGGFGESFGGHKGYGLALVVELLCGALAGADWGRHVYGPAGAGIGHFILCLRVDGFLDVTEFASAANDMFAELRRARRAPGGPAVRIPGDSERSIRHARVSEGIPLADDVGRLLIEIADELQVPAPAGLVGLYPHKTSSE
jgi:L-2-hydroxycarboxylate dehydrogenase (NAD+)